MSRLFVVHNALKNTLRQQTRNFSPKTPSGGDVLRGRPKRLLFVNRQTYRTYSNSFFTNKSRLRCSVAHREQYERLFPSKFQGAAGGTRNGQTGQAVRPTYTNRVVRERARADDNPEVKEGIFSFFTAVDNFAVSGRVVRARRKERCHPGAPISCVGSGKLPPSSCVRERRRTRIIARSVIKHAGGRVCVGKCAVARRVARGWGGGCCRRKTFCFISSCISLCRRRRVRERH